MTPDGKWCSVEEACGIAGCTDGLIRLRIREGKLQGLKFNGRAWMVSVEGCKALREQLAPNSNVRKAEAKEAALRSRKAKGRAKTR